MSSRRFVTGILAAVATAAALLALSAGPSRAFSGGNHAEATKPALAGRTSADAAEAITNANKAVDSGPYSGADHFDRNPGKTDAQAFQDAAANFRKKRDDAIAEMKACHTENALKLIGEALHILQDFYSHSNYVDMNAAEQAACEAALKDPAKPLPAGLKLTGYDNSGTGTGKYNPKGDTYEHGLYWGHHKDTASTGDGNRNITKGGVTKTAFEWAMEAAKKASKDLIDEIIAAVGLELWNFKFATYMFPPKPSSFPSVPIPPFWIGPFDYMSPLYDFLKWYRPGAFGNLTPLGGIMDNSMGTAVFVPRNAVCLPGYVYAIDVMPGSIPCDWYPPGVWPIKIREVGIGDTSLLLPVTVGITYTVQELGPIPECLLRVYEFDLYRNALWTQVPGVQLDPVHGAAYFPTDHPGIYCLGGELPVQPTIPHLLSMPDGTPVNTLKNVTLAPRAAGVRVTSFFYVEDENRVAGMRIENAPGIVDDLNVNDLAQINGAMASNPDTGERFVQLDSYPAGSPGVEIKTLGANNRSVLTDPKLIAKLVTSWGKIRSIADDKSSFTITDGFAQMGAEALTTVLVFGDSNVAALFVGDFVSVVGVVSKTGTSPSTAQSVIIYRSVPIIVHSAGPP